MALLTGPRNTPRLGDVRFKAYPIEASTTLWLGGMVCIDNNGYLYPAQPTGSSPIATEVAIVGISHNVVGGDFGQNAVNVAGAAMIPSPANLGSAGALWMNVARGIFLFDNTTGGNAVVQATIGNLVFALDDHTVSIAPASGVNPVVGRVVELTGAGQVWVDMNQQSILATTGVH